MHAQEKHRKVPSQFATYRSQTDRKKRLTFSPIGVGESFLRAYWGMIMTVFCTV
uniref:Uncharacterized protein n=1 Tax=Arundo donax TaxID=35708 RepID=A0A0A8XTA6_ARUDO